MKLYYSAASPFVRKAVVTLHETGLAEGVALVDTASDPRAETLDQPNPLGKIPALETESGEVIFDSTVICRYLNRIAGASLYPAGTEEWEALTLEAAADGIMDAAVLMVYERRWRDPAHYSEQWVEGQWRKVTRALDHIERNWRARLDGPLNIGHIALGCALGYLDFRHDARNWREGRPRLTDWSAQIMARESFVATRPPEG